MLVEIAIGDAYGAGFEYAAPEIFGRNDLSGYLPHPLYATVPGSYTDDAQMSIAVAEAMLTSAKTPSKLEFADRFVDAFRRDRRRGYASRFYDLLSTLTSGQALIEHIVPKSDRSGAAMRATPIGLYPDLETVAQVTALQASITHDTPAGIEAAQAAAMMTFYFRNRIGPKSDLRDWLVRQLGSAWRKAHEGPVGERGMEAVNAALTAIESGDRLSIILKLSVAFQGDVDTAAAVAMGAAVHASDVEHDLPSVLYDGLEAGTYGTPFLVELDRQLELRFSPNFEAAPERH